ncbi:hypothetical protein QTP70_001511 [Hemibagrus guttatus]|uniref:Uncharacterized protein n=1 Tax=Hemibagrus guttatus TaxID=175788 RepID=A0AAE0UUP8_9TELE|nr:hypothetical protein QTP70_001511 [Hemibagrus guttatus]
MKVSRSKTEYMCVNEREGSGTVRLQGEEVKKVQEFKYLRSTVQSNGECGKEVKKRVQAGWNGWRKVSGVLCDRKISARIKGKVYRTVVRPAMLYGLETVSLRKRQESELEVAELKMLRCPYPEQPTVYLIFLRRGRSGGFMGIDYYAPHSPTPRRDDNPRRAGPPCYVHWNVVPADMGEERVQEGAQYTALGYAGVQCDGRCGDVISFNMLQSVGQKVQCRKTWSRRDTMTLTGDEETLGITGNAGDSKRNGVGVVVKEEFVRNVLEVKRVSDRVMSLKLEIEGVMLNVVSGYAPQVVLPDDWETTAEVIRETGRKVLGVSSGRRKEDKATWWWNEEVQDSIQRKRLAKKKWDMDRTEENRQEYKELQRRVKREVSKAKQKAYDELYTRLDTREGEKDLYRLARQRDRDGKDVQQVRVIKDRDGRVLTSEESIQRRWKEYFEELMNEENEREKE